jgi:hypothetical protein
VKIADGDSYVVHATEWRIGRLRSVTPVAVYVFHDMTDSQPNTQARALEEASDKEFAA